MDKVRWGILSTARINRRIIPAVRESSRATLVAVASRDLQKAERYADNWDIGKAYGSYEELLNADDIDAVYISTPNASHADWTIKALKAGKHVLCEKPLCLSLEEMEKIKTAVAETGKHVAEGYMYLHHAQTRYFKQLITDGAIGELRSLDSNFCFTWSRAADNYRMTDQNGGGSLWDVGVYPITFFEYLVGRPAIEVKGQGFPKLVDTSFNAVLDYGEGVVGRFYCGFDGAYTMETTIHGTEGILHISRPYNYMEDGSAWIETDKGRREVEQHAGDLYAPEVEDINDVVLNGTAPLISLDFSESCLRTILQLRKSAGYLPST